METAGEQRDRKQWVWRERQKKEFTTVWTETDDRERLRETERAGVRKDKRRRGRVKKRLGQRERERGRLERGAEKSSPFSESVISRLRVYRKNPVN